MERTFVVRLVIAQGFTMAAARLANELWPDNSLMAAADTLRSHASHIRKAAAAVAGPAGKALLVTDRVRHGSAYRLDLAPERIDAVRMNRLQVLAARKRDSGWPEEAAADLEAALALWGGAPVADATEWEFGRAHIKRLTDVYREIVVALAEIRLDQGRSHQVIGHLGDLRDVRSSDVRVRELLVHALDRVGRVGEALDECGKAIEDFKRLGLPTTHLEEVYLAVLRGQLPRSGDASTHVPHSVHAVTPRMGGR
jgi:DNA-binding SARP family transcriptional activator